MAAIKRLSLVDQVYAQIRTDIVTCTLPLGSKINVNKMQEEYHVSSTPVREALNRLLNEGLIEMVNNVGAKVVEITEDDVRNIQELAGAYEMAAARYALQRGDRGQIIAEIEQIIEQYRSAYDAKEICECVRQINQVFYKFADNSLLESQSISINGLEEILHTLFSMNGKKDGSEEVYKDGILYFQKILQAVEKGNFADVCDAYDEHKTWARAYIVKNLRDCDFSKSS